MENGPFSGLDVLLRKDEAASRYYLSLPDYVRDQIGTRAGNIESLENLRDYAENLLRGDD